MPDETKDVIICNIIDEDKKEKDILNVLNVIRKTLVQTMGPYGKDVMIQDHQSFNHYSTKDGHHILGKMSFKDSLSQTIHAFLKAVSGKLNRTVGDGTTSSIIIATTLFKGLLEDSEISKLRRRDVIDNLKSSADYLIKQMRLFSAEYTKNFTTEEIISKVATLSANNDKSIGELFNEIYSKGNEHIKIKVSHGNADETKVNFSSGIEIARGFAAPGFQNSNEEYVFEIAEPTYFISETPLTVNDCKSFGVVLQDCVARSIPLVMIAPSYDDQFLNFLYTNKMQFKDSFIVCPTTIATKTKTAKDILNDIAVYTGAEIYNHYKEMSLYKFLNNDNGTIDHSVLGKSDSVKITENSTLISGAKPEQNEKIDKVHKSISEIIIKLQNEVDKFDNTEAISILKSRINSLSNNGVAEIVVGGGSLQDIKNKYFLLEDASYAVKSAIKNGIVPGSLLAIHIANENNSYIKNSNNENAKIVNNFLISVYKNVYQQLLRVNEIEEFNISLIISSCLNECKVYNILEDKLENAVDTSVINSIETDIEILKTAINIVSLLFNSANFISSDSYYEFKNIGFKKSNESA